MYFFSWTPRGFLGTKNAFFVLGKCHSNVPSQALENGFQSVQNLDLVTHYRPTPRPSYPIHLHNDRHRFLTSAKKTIKLLKSKRCDTKADSTCFWGGKRDDRRVGDRRTSDTSRKARTSHGMSRWGLARISREACPERAPGPRSSPIPSLSKALQQSCER